MRSRNPRQQPGREVGDFDAVLFVGVAFADGDGVLEFGAFFAEGFGVDGDAEGGAASSWRA